MQPVQVLNQRHSDQIDSLFDRQKISYNGRFYFDSILGTTGEKDTQQTTRKESVDNNGRERNTTNYEGRKCGQQGREGNTTSENNCLECPVPLGLHFRGFLVSGASVNYFSSRKIFRWTWALLGLTLALIHECGVL